ncbi:MAG: hypothetical protein WHV44_13700 [Anaerolineales bacterium]
MTIPAFLFGLVLATLLGSVFHLWRGGDNRRLVIFLLLAQVGFWGGHVAAWYFDWQFADLGVLHLGAAVAGAVILLLVTDFIGRLEFFTAPKEQD